MFGQFFVELEPDALLEPEEEPDEPEEPELVLLDPEFPVLVDGVVVDGVVVEEPELDEFEVAVAPELPVVLEVVAALATRAPPARRPEARAPVASAVRTRIFIGGSPFVWCPAPAHSGRHHTGSALDLWVGAKSRRGLEGVT